MSYSQSQPTLREWRAYMARRQTLTALLAASLFVTLVAPFNSSDYLRPLPRFGYWVAMVFGTFSAGSLISFFLQPQVKGTPLWVRTLVLGLATSLGVMAVVFTLNLLVHGWVPPNEEWPIFALTLIVLTLIITGAFQYVGEIRSAPEQSPTQTQASAAGPATPSVTQSTAQTDPQEAPLLSRLPFDKRGPLLALSVEDHYVRIVTTKGEELVLMRLSDAIREVGDTRGDQVHRSHWVAYDGVQSVRREGDRAIVTLKGSGTEIPVSRANIAKIKEAGLLPRT